MKLSLTGFQKGDTIRIQNEFFVLDTAGHSINISFESQKAKVTIGEKTKEFALHFSKIEIKNEGNTLTIEYSTQAGNSKEFNIFIDALNLKNKKKIENIKTAYGINEESPFFNATDFDGSKSQNAGSAPLRSSDSGGFEVTSLADGLAKFLVGRVKKELSIAFFERFKSKMKEGRYKDLDLIFHETYDQLNLIDEKVYDFKPYLNGIRVAAMTDFKTLPSNLPKLLNKDTRFYKEFEGKPDVLYGFGLGFGLIEELNQERNLGLALENLNPRLKEGVDVKLLNSVETVRLISFSLKGNNTEENSYYLSKKQIEQLLTDTTLLRYYKGLILAYSQLETAKQTVPISKDIKAGLKSYLEKMSFLLY
ncbi:MAG: hypothetical protein LRY55_11925 [Leadbetterella sp.]|nr:hypothetical protein [Leadbetterella sp.]